MAKIDAYETVTNQIIAQLEAGVVVWQKPWNAGVGAPRNLDGRNYRGINILLLGSHNYDDPRWGTFKNISERGGKVKKGEKGQIVVFFKMLESKTEVDAKGRPKKIPMLRYFYVFNVRQTQGLDLPTIDTEFTYYNDDEHVTRLGEDVLGGYEDAPEFRVDSIAASYNPGTDVIRMPEIERFDTAADYYLTAFHECVHSTGHERRLARPEIIDGGSEKYSREELVAEMGSAMVAARVGIETHIENSASYLAGWLKALGDDKKLIVSAATRATAAADWIIEGPKIQED